MSTGPANPFDNIPTYYNLRRIPMDELNQIVEKVFDDNYQARPNKLGQTGLYFPKFKSDLKTAIQIYCDKQSIGVRIDELKAVKFNMKDAESPKHYRADLALNYISHRLAELESAPINSESKGEENV